MLCRIPFSRSICWYCLCWYCQPWSEWRIRFVPAGIFANASSSMVVTMLSTGRSDTQMFFFHGFYNHSLELRRILFVWYSFKTPHLLNSISYCLTNGVQFIRWFYFFFDISKMIFEIITFISINYYLIKIRFSQRNEEKT